MQWQQISYENNDGYSVIKSHSEYEYEEEYFEPASKEDELYLQLERLSVPILEKNDLQ